MKTRIASAFASFAQLHADFCPHVPTRHIFTLFARWSIVGSLTALVFCLVHALLAGQMPHAATGHSRLWDMLAGPLWAGLIFGSWWVYRLTQDPSNALRNIDGIIFFSMEAVALGFLWLVALAGIRTTCLDGIHAAYKQMESQAFLLTVAVLCILFNIPTVIQNRIGALNRSDTWPGRFLSGRSISKHE